EVPIRTLTTAVDYHILTPPGSLLGDLRQFLSRVRPLWRPVRLMAASWSTAIHLACEFRHGPPPAHADCNGTGRVLQLKTLPRRGEREGYLSRNPRRGYRAGKETDRTTTRRGSPKGR